MPATHSSTVMSHGVGFPLPKGSIVSTSGKIIRDDDLGQFWGNGQKGRTDVFGPTDLAWSRLQRFFDGNDEAFAEWQENRLASSGMDQEMTLADERALSVARGLCRIQQRILGLFNTVVSSENQTLPRSAKISEGLLELLPRKAQSIAEGPEGKEETTLNANEQATAILADNWSIACARGDLGLFSQNFAALAFCFQMLSTKGLDGLYVLFATIF